MQQGFVGYVAGDSTSGNRALYELGMTGIPIVNVNNNCSTGSTALFLAAQTIRGGLADCAIALGFEKMQPGPLQGGAEDRESPMGKHIKAMAEIDEFAFPVAPWMFGAAGREHMRQYGTTAEHFAKIGLKNHKHSVNNPYAQFQEEYTLDDILAARMISDPLTKLQCSPTSDGSGAAILASEAFVDKHGPGGSGRRDRRPGDDHRLRQHLRRQRQEPHRLRHECARRRSRFTTSLVSAPRTSR